MLCNTRDLTANVYMCKCVCLPEYLIQMGTFYAIIKMSSYPISSTEAQMLSVCERACVCHYTVCFILTNLKRKHKAFTHSRHEEMESA